MVLNNYEETVIAYKEQLLVNHPFYNVTIQKQDTG
jgi:hypothetical protein